jgi:hypothetical protein
VITALGAASAGCTESSAVTDPDGGNPIANLAPWDDPNMAPLPPATATHACAEELVVVPQGTIGRFHQSHAKGCIHAPLSEVWPAITDPEVAHVASLATYMVVEPRMETECPGIGYDSIYQTQWSQSGVDARLCWRHVVAEGTPTAPTRTLTRWQKVWGTIFISVMEGSLVASPHPTDPSITVVEYQYHLGAAMSDHATIEAFLTEIFTRLVARTHGTL